MIRMNGKSSRILVYLLMFSGAVGTILFFPINLDGNHTCLYQQVFAKESGIHPQTSLYSSILDSNNQKSQDRSKEYPIHQKQPLDKYVIPYGLSWWASLGLVGMGIFGIRRLNKINNSSNWKV
jgi:hypothetical protein